MKNNLMLSMGKFNFSPNFEHTPKALSWKNSLIFSIVLIVKVLSKKIPNFEDNLPSL